MYLSSIPSQLHSLQIFTLDACPFVFFLGELVHYNMDQVENSYDDSRSISDIDDNRTEIYILSVGK